MKKNAALALLLLNLSSFSAFSAGNESDNNIIDSLVPNQNIDNLVPNPVQQRIINQTNFLFKSHLIKKNIPIENYFEIIDIVTKISYKENWNYYEISRFINIIFDLNLNIIDLKNIIELSFELLKNTSSKPRDYEALAKFILKKDLLNNNHILEFLKDILKDNNLDLKSSLTPFIEAICDTNDEGRANLLDWQKNIFTFLPCSRINTDAFSKLFHYIANNPSQKPSEHHVLFLKLLGQKELTHSINEKLANVLMSSHEASFKAARTLLEIIFATHPSWTYDDCLTISQYILDRAMSLEFVERFDFASNLIENSDWRVENYIKYINDLYILPEHDFKNIVPLFDKIFSINPSWTYDNYQAIYDNIVEHYTKPDFIERVNLSCRVLKNKNLDNALYKDYIRQISMLSEQDFKNATLLFDKLLTINPSWTYNDFQFISLHLLNKSILPHFKKRFNYACSILDNNDNINLTDFKNYIQYFIDLSEEKFTDFMFFFKFLTLTASTKKIKFYSHPESKKYFFGITINNANLKIETLTQFVKVISFLFKKNSKELSTIILPNPCFLELNNIINLINKICTSTNIIQEPEILNFLEDKNWSPINNIKFIEYIPFLKNNNNIFEYIKEKNWNENETISFISSVYLFKTYSERNNFIQFLDEGNLENNEIVLLHNILNSTNDITHIINSFNIIKKNNDINKKNHLDIIRSLSDYDPIDRLHIAEKLKDFDAETTEGIAQILYIIFFMPSTYHPIFVNYIKTISEQEKNYYENSNNTFFCVLKNCFHTTADDLKKNWLDHWHKILISYNKENVIALVNFINAHKNDIPFNENDIKLTITIPAIMGYANNSYINHQNLLKKRQTFTKVSHEALHIDEIENQKISLNPQFFETLSNKLSIDPSSVPKISADVFLSVLDGIEKDMENKEVAAEVYGLIGDFNNLKHNISSNDSYLVFLLNTSADHLIGAQFKCIMNHILSLPKERLPNQLSDQQAAYLKTIYSIFACPVGKDAGIVNAYISLPNESKLLFNNNTDNEEMNDEYVESVSHQKTLNFIYSMLQEKIDQLFYNNDLLCAICKTDPNIQFNIDMIAQPVHQSLYLRNLMGDLVGSRYGVEFDFHYFENNTSPYFLNLKRQKAIDTYYEHAKPNTFIKFIQAKINEALEIEFAKNRSPSGKQTRHIYNGICDMLAETISPNDIWDTEEDDDFMPISIKIKDKAVFELLLKIKAISKI